MEGGELAPWQELVRVLSPVCRDSGAPQTRRLQGAEDLSSLVSPQAASYSSQTQDISKGYSLPCLRAETTVMVTCPAEMTMQDLSTLGLGHLLPLHSLLQLCPRKCAHVAFLLMPRTSTLSILWSSGRSAWSGPPNNWNSQGGRRYVSDKEGSLREDLSGPCVPVRSFAWSSVGGSWVIYNIRLGLLSDSQVPGLPVLILFLKTGPGTAQVSLNVQDT